MLDTAQRPAVSTCSLFLTLTLVATLSEGQVPSKRPPSLSFYQRRRRKSSKRSFLSRFVHRVVPCVGQGPQQPEPVKKPEPVIIPVDSEVIVPPPPSAHTLPDDETDGLTSGAVQPPGSTGDLVRTATRETQESDGTEYSSEIIDDEDRLIRNGGSGIPIGPDGLPRPLLPPIAAHHLGRKCLVLDLDETLVHSSFKAIPHPDFIVPVEIECHWHHFHVLKRPGVDTFLKKMGEHFEIVIFTASLSKVSIH